MGERLISTAIIPTNLRRHKQLLLRQAGLPMRNRLSTVSLSQCVTVPGCALLPVDASLPGFGWDRRLGGEGPALVGVAGAVAKVHDQASEGLAGPVEGRPGEAVFLGGADGVGGLDGGSCRGEVVEEPLRAEVELGGLRWRLHVL
jgi:hypothetical protein